MNTYTIIIFLLAAGLVFLWFYLNNKLQSQNKELVKQGEKLNTLEQEKAQLGNKLNLISSEKALFEQDKIKAAEKNKKLFQLSETVYKEKKKVDEQNELLEEEKTKLAAEKAKVDDKVKKLWTQSVAVHKEKERITLLKNAIELRHREILDSVTYAKRIQRALLASEKTLQEHLPDYFILFQPKDIVSGDFYIAGTLSENIFSVVAADSTGHGVPGAIMSILNISCLNEATGAKKLILPNEILDYARLRIMEHMANDGSEEGGKDGMDAVICNFDFKQNLLQFSAANNPLWLIRNNELLEFKPDKMPIGKPLGDLSPFTLQELPLQKNDLIILLSDGYADQFGGEKGKKFMYKPLKELILSMNNLPLANIKEELLNRFNAWKGENEQVDDVLIMGIRI